MINDNHFQEVQCKRKSAFKKLDLALTKLKAQIEYFDVLATKLVIEPSEEERKKSAIEIRKVFQNVTQNHLDLLKNTHEYFKHSGNVLIINDKSK